MKKLLVSVVAAASLAIPVGWVTAASASPAPDPDANGDLHSNCHTGSKLLGAGGEDRFKLHGNGEGPCVFVPPPAPTPGPSGVSPVSAQGAAPTPARTPPQRPAVPAAGVAVPVQGVPRTTG